MTLGQKRVIFSVNHAKLILWLNGIAGESAYTKEVERSLAKAEENAESGSGISNSLHLLGLAADIIILVHDEYAPDDVDIYRPAGTYWKSLHPLNRWGGDFSKPDADHFSMEHNGVK